MAKNKNEEIAASFALHIGCLVWIKDDYEAWIAGEVIAISGEEIKVLCTSGKTVVVKSSDVYSRDGEAPTHGMDRSMLAHLHKPVVLPNLKIGYDISEDFGEWDSDDDYGEVDPHYDPREFEDICWNNKEYVEKYCLDRLGVKKAALPNSSEVASFALGVGCLVWVKDHDEALIDGEVIAVSGDDIKVVCTSGETVVVKSTNVFPKDGEAPTRGMDRSRLAHLHEPVVLPNLKTRYDISDDFGDWDSDDDYGEVDPHYDPREFVDMLWNNKEHVEKCCFDSLRVKKNSKATALPESSSEVCTSLPELPFELQVKILALAEVGLDKMLVLSTRWYRELYPEVQDHYFSLCQTLSHVLGLGGAILGLMSEGETIWGCFHRYMIDEIVEGDALLDLETRLGELSLIAHQRGLCHWKLTKDGLNEFLIEVEKTLTMVLSTLFLRILEAGIDD